MYTYDMCVYIYIYIHIYMYVYTHLSLSLYIYIYIHLSLSIYIYTQLLVTRYTCRLCATCIICIRGHLLTPLPITAVTPPPYPPVTGVMGGHWLLHG